MARRDESPKSIQAKRKPCGGRKMGVPGEHPLLPPPPALGMSFKKCHILNILKLQTSNPCRDSNLHPSIGGKHANHYTIHCPYNPCLTTHNLLQAWSAGGAQATAGCRSAAGISSPATAAAAPTPTTAPPPPATRHPHFCHFKMTLRRLKRPTCASTHLSQILRLP